MCNAGNADCIEAIFYKRFTIKVHISFPSKLMVVWKIPYSLRGVHVQYKLLNVVRSNLVVFLSKGSFSIYNMFKMYLFVMPIILHDLFACVHVHFV